jgi:hypothetical protein
MIINHCIIIINVYYNYIINAYHNYYISNEVLLEEGDKEENLAVTVAALFPVQKNIVKRFVQCYEFAQSPPGRHPSAKYQVNTSHISRFV